MTRARSWLFLLLVSTPLTSCAGLRDLFLAPSRERPVEASDSYLESAGGPQTGVDLGAGGEQLLTRFQTLLEEKAVYEQRQSELMAEVDALRTSLQQEQEDRDKEVRLRAGAEAEADRLRRIKTERELKILHLQMQVADLQRSKLMLEIAGIEDQIARLDDSANQLATPPEPPR